MRDKSSIRICITIILFYLFFMIFDIIVTLTVHQLYPLIFSQAEVNPITLFFIENFYFPFNLIIPFIAILLAFVLTKDRYKKYGKDKKIYYITGIICYCIAMSVIHIVGASGAFIYGWI